MFRCGCHKIVVQRGNIECLIYHYCRNHEIMVQHVESFFCDILHSTGEKLRLLTRNYCQVFLCSHARKINAYNWSCLLSNVKCNLISNFKSSLYFFFVLVEFFFIQQLVIEAVDKKFCQAFSLFWCKKD